MGNYVVQAPTGIFTETDAAKRYGDSRIANLLRTGGEQIAGGEGVAGIPEDGAIRKAPDLGLTGVVLVVLMAQHIDEGLSEGNKIGGSVVPLHGRRVEPKGDGGEFHIPVQEREPRLNDVGLHDHTVQPAYAGRILAELETEALAIRHGTRHHASQIAVRTEE